MSEKSNLYLLEKINQKVTEKIKDKNSKENFFNENKKLIYSICWKFKKKNSHIELNDLIGESNIAFLIAYHSFDTTKEIKFSTYLYKVISNTLKSYCKEENKHIQLELNENLTFVPDFKFFELSDKTQNIIRSLQDEEITLNKKNKINKKSLTDYIHKKFNYKHREIYNSFIEIKEYLV
jgi:RNA polymerase sigma factor (sigma-70 family)